MASIEDSTARRSPPHNGNYIREFDPEGECFHRNLRKKKISPTSIHHITLPSFE